VFVATTLRRVRAEWVRLPLWTAGVTNLSSARRGQQKCLDGPREPSTTATSARARSAAKDHDRQQPPRRIPGTGHQERHQCGLGHVELEIAGDALEGVIRHGDVCVVDTSGAAIVPCRGAGVAG